MEKKLQQVLDSSSSSSNSSERETKLNAVKHDNNSFVSSRQE